VKFTHVSIQQRREMGPTLYVPGLQAFYYVCCLQHEFPCLTVPDDAYATPGLLQISSNCLTCCRFA
jgi:hypothetical protein